MQTLNINNTVQFRLTQIGGKVFAEYRKTHNLPFPYPFRISHDNSAYEAPCWQFCNVFGGHFRIGADSMILENTMKVEMEAPSPKPVVWNRADRRRKK